MALSRTVAGGQGADGGVAGRAHAAGKGGPPGQTPGHSGAVDQKRHGQLSQSFLQGPGGERGVEPCEGTGLHHRGLRLDGQSGQLGGRERRISGTESVCFYSVGPGAGQDRQLSHLRRECDRHKRPLR